MAPRTVKTKARTMEMSKERDTKNTVRFQEDVDGDGYAHTLYISKEAFAELGNPDSITVIIEAN